MSFFVAISTAYLYYKHITSISDFYSETDDDMHMVKTVKSCFDITDNTKKVLVSHVSIDTISENLLSQQDLVSHAGDIHRASGGWSAVTIVCAQYQTSDKRYLRVAFSNSQIPSPAARQKAEELGYVACHGIVSHAELNMIFYSDKHKRNLRFINHGCNRPACGECASLLRFRFGGMVDLGTRERRGNPFSKQYKTHGIQGIAPPIRGPYEEIIRENYTADGKYIVPKSNL